MADLVGRHTLDLAAIEFDGATIWRKQARNQVEQRGFAGAVRTYQCVDLTSANGKACILDRANAAEMLGDVVDLQHRALKAFGQQETRERQAFVDPALAH